MLLFREGETARATYYHHGFLLFLELAPVVLFACVIVALALLGVTQLPDEYTLFIPLLLLGAVAFLHIFWIVLFVVLIDFSLDFWVLTDRRVIAVEQRGLFSQSVGEFELAKIQDVMVEVNGILGTMLDYGTIKVSTAGEHQDFSFRYMRNPNAVRDAILEASIAQKPVAQA
ncbi:hypothetical protein A3C91_00755 [Candidatus Azambacteria bacterium RIFCSPHIGHO2_02_FULL_52_12]|uniref:YdbS-like PH domain-containing protein n=1 Tax=Candidatus Azambacteria bacterium RIFCSPLOWO2_01_FULL_46_25 TaxID=1797298 RepID=A0A1F5BTY1_9BACT|nr:MAG: hypothetical protein A3C91_00755 [Candidatus Azambacteria bacterium RIFCSPHIGHO2_02_FULL_52_12]OGD34054.1 MAG: hypothetical protein A2988_01035 [Candidatus Azambacteria bacterium RIFCSPLOWO2_01_FULL_46_25]OGD37805.1 MAG: hypothetical protein A2850_04375 [Candidatus Azambacteria bacterium RIFCSPHIGHO2_01_FULL_51_74]